MFWSAVLLVVFTFSLYWLANGALALTGDFETSRDNLLAALGCVAAMALILIPLAIYSAHPRTRSSAATTSFSLMKSLMLIAGIIVFVGGASGIIKANGSGGEIALALVSLFYVATPLILHLTKR